jgi:hypothetical protein
VNREKDLMRRVDENESMRRKGNQLWDSHVDPPKMGWATYFYRDLDWS